MPVARTGEISKTPIRMERFSSRRWCWIGSCAMKMGEEQWRPGFVDYLFLAYNTSTAFSPTDVPVLSRWAKVLMMVQATISLATVALLAARAVNIL